MNCKNNDDDGGGGDSDGVDYDGDYDDNSSDDNSYREMKCKKTQRERSGKITSRGEAKGCNWAKRWLRHSLDIPNRLFSSALLSSLSLPTLPCPSSLYPLSSLSLTSFLSLPPLPPFFFPSTFFLLLFSLYHLVASY